MKDGIKTVFWGFRWFLAIILIIIATIGLSNGYGDKIFAFKMIIFAFLLIIVDLIKIIKFILDD